MIRLFLGLTCFNLLSLTATAAIGYGAALGQSWLGPLHQLAGVLASLACCAIHCIVFTYFAATAKWIQHAVQVKQLDPALAAPTRSFKAQAFPAALAAMFAVILTAVIGVITFSYGIRPLWHQTAALLALAVNAIVARIEYQSIARNAALIDRVLQAASHLDASDKFYRRT